MWPVLVFTLAFFVYSMRFVTAVQVGTSWDDAEYLILAESFATGRPYRVISYPDGPLETTFPPGYPLLILTPVWLIVGPNYEILRATSVALALANIALAYGFFRRHVAEPYLSLIVALFALNHFVAGAAGVALSESSFIFFTLAFVVLFDFWLSSSRLLNHYFVLAVIALTAAVLVRYQGLALVGASVFYLVYVRRPMWAVSLVLGFIVALSPFGLFLASQEMTSESVHAIGLLNNRLHSLGNDLPVSLINYWRTIPLVLVPVLGPTASATLGELGLAWLADAVHSAILLVTVLGVWQGLVKRQFVAWYTICYFGLVVFITGVSTGIVFDPPRYTGVALPFLYLMLFQGLLYMGNWLFRNRQQAKTATMLVGSCLLLILLLRNVRQAGVDFPVPDLSAAADWVQAKTPRDSIVMCPDPVPRYLYLRRKTVGYPQVDDAQSFVAQAETLGVNYVIVTPPLTIARIPNTEQRWGPCIECIVMPAIADNPDRFSLVFRDNRTNTSVYHVGQH